MVLNSGIASHPCARDSAIWTGQGFCKRSSGVLLWLQSSGSLGQRSKTGSWMCLGPQGASVEMAKLAGGGTSFSTWPLVLKETNSGFLKGSLGAAGGCDWKLHTP